MGTRVSNRSSSGSRKTSSATSKAATGGASASGSAPSAATPQGSQYSSQALSSILRDLKAEVTKQAGSTMPTSKGDSSELSDFERVFMDFFGGDRSFQASLKKAEQNFDDRTLEAWKEFYDTFYAYAQEKKAPSGTIKKFIYRGIVKNESRLHGDETSPMVVGDLVLSRTPRDRIEKFVRLPIPNKSIETELQCLKPGTVIPDSLFNALLTGDELAYLNLCYKPVRKGLQQAKGGALAQNLERQAAAAKRATEAMTNRSMGISSKAANLAAEQMKKK